MVHVSQQHIGWICKGGTGHLPTGGAAGGAVLLQNYTCSICSQSPSTPSLSIHPTELEGKKEEEKSRNEYTLPHPTLLHWASEEQVAAVCPEGHKAVGMQENDPHPLVLPHTLQAPGTSQPHQSHQALWGTPAAGLL